MQAIDFILSALRDQMKLTAKLTIAQLARINLFSVIEISPSSDPIIAAKLTEIEKVRSRRAILSLYITLFRHVLLFFVHLLNFLKIFNVTRSN